MSHGDGGGVALTAFTGISAANAALAVNANAASDETTIFFIVPTLSCHQGRGPTSPDEHHASTKQEIDPADPRNCRNSCARLVYQQAENVRSCCIFRRF